MRWEADVVILHQAASLFKKVESRLVIYQDASPFEYIETGTMHDTALVIRHSTVVKTGDCCDVSLWVFHLWTSFLACCRRYHTDVGKPNAGAPLECVKGLFQVGNDIFRVFKPDG